MEGPGPDQSIRHDPGPVANDLPRDPLNPARSFRPAARREKVIRRIRRGSAPLTIRWATR